MQFAQSVYKPVKVVALKKSSYHYFYNKQMFKRNKFNFQSELNI